MDFLNLGSGEFVFLILLAILLVGPKRAVEWVQQAGRFATRIRQEWLAVQRDVMKEVQALSRETADALQPALKEVAQEGQGVLQDVTQSVQALQDTRREITSLQEQMVSEGLPSLADVPEPTDDFAG
jgi:sec-independent protein translocase protein TatB